MKLIKLISLFSIIFFCSFFLFSPAIFPENLQFKEFLNSSCQADVLIIFNSGGWGNTPLEDAKDFTPIIKGIQETLQKLGINSEILPYQRTKNCFLGKITSAKDTFWSFRNQSENLAKEIKEFLRKNPQKKIVIAGLSNGAAFVDETMGKLAKETEDKVFAIEVGLPFWKKALNSENILRLDNEGKDTFSKGEIKTLIYSLFKAPFLWVSAQISGEQIAFPQAFQAPGHQYFWDTAEVSLRVVSFLEDKIR